MMSEAGRGIAADAAREPDADENDGPAAGREANENGGRGGFVLPADFEALIFIAAEGKRCDSGVYRDLDCRG